MACKNSDCALESLIELQKFRLSLLLGRAESKVREKEMVEPNLLALKLYSSFGASQTICLRRHIQLFETLLIEMS